jgi:outer membrane protein assembly factor BamB
MVRSRVAALAALAAIAVGLLAAPLAVSATATSDPWRQAGYDAAATAYNAGERQLVPSTVGELTRKWRIARSRRSAVGGFAAGGHTLYIAEAGGIYCYAMQTGRYLRHYRLSHTIEVPGPPLLSSHHLITTVGGDLSSLNLATGRRAWSVREPDTSGVFRRWSAVILAGTTIYAVLSTTTIATQTSTDALEAISASSGRQIWSATGVFGPIAAGESRVYAQQVAAGSGPNSIDHAVVALSAGTGVSRWTFPLARAQVVTDLVVAGRTVVVGAGGSAVGKDVYSLSAATGALKWSHADPPTGKFPESPAGQALLTDGKRLVYLSAQSRVVALQLRTGRLLWKRPAGQASAVGGGGVVYVRTPDGHDRAYRISNGQPLWTSDSAGLAPWLVADGRLLVVGHNIVAFGRG